MFKEDTEMGKIEVLPGLRNLIDDYTEKARAATEDVKVVLLEKHGNLSKQVEIFTRKYETLQVEAQEASIASIETYRRVAKPLLKQAGSAVSDTNSNSSMGNSSNNSGGDAIHSHSSHHSGSLTGMDADSSAANALLQLQEAKAASERLHSDLMNVESDLVEMAQELIASMEVSIEAVGVEARELATEHFRSIEMLENNFFENVSQLAVTLLERMASEDAEEDDLLTDECRAILNDRDALNNAINGSHDIHIGKLLAQEDAMREQSLAQIADRIKSAKEREWSRNRARVAEVIQLKEKHLAEINRVHDELNRVDDEFY